MYSGHIGQYDQASLILIDIHEGSYVMIRMSGYFPANWGIVFLDFGNGFFRTTQAYFDGREVKVKFLSRQKLEIIVPPDLLAKGRVVKVQVENIKPGGGRSKALAFTVMNPVPKVKSVSPAEVVLKSGAFEATLSGE